MGLDVSAFLVTGTRSSDLYLKILLNDRKSLRLKSKSACNVSPYNRKYNNLIQQKVIEFLSIKSSTNHVYTSYLINSFLNVMDMSFSSIILWVDGNHL
jgi:hypothetical protein